MSWNGWIKGSDLSPVLSREGGGVFLFQESRPWLTVPLFPSLYIVKIFSVCFNALFWFFEGGRSGLRAASCLMKTSDCSSLVGVRLHTLEPPGYNELGQKIKVCTLHFRQNQKHQDW